MRFRSGNRLAAILLFALLSAFVVTTFTAAYLGAPSTSHAQDGGGSAAAKKPKQEMSVLGFIWQALGWFYLLVFLLISFIFVALFVMNLLSARRGAICPLFLVEQFEGLLNERRYQEAYELAKTDDSVLGNVLSAGLARLSAGYAKAIEAMQERGEEENMKLEHRLSYIALIGTISPMVGLFGTVHGMIDSFWVIFTAGGTADAGELAGGVAKALLTTLVGLFIAIPAIIVYNVLRNIVSRRVLEVGIFSEDLMSRFENVGGQKK